MKEVIFSTSNIDKFTTAKNVCDKYGLTISQKTIDVIEIQEENPKRVALDKANKAYALTNKPVVISDDSWAFKGLNGFPGVYMHSINEWFKPEDFLRLTFPLDDRRVTLTQYLVYTDKDTQRVFKQQTDGILLKEIKGTSKHASHTIVSMDGDEGLSLAEVYNKSQDRSGRAVAQIWHDFASWFINK